MTAEDTWCPEAIKTYCLPNTSNRCTWCGRPMPKPRLRSPDPDRNEFFRRAGAQHDPMIRDMGTDPILWEDGVEEERRWRDPTEGSP